MKQICTSSLLLLSFFIGSDGIAQLAIGQWRDHLSYKKGIAVTQSDDKVYCATQSGIFTVDKADNSIDRLSKINGLSDVSVNTLRFNDYDKTLLIAYQNANIDLIFNKNIYNISDIKRSIITAKKTINNIHFRNELAYLACGFGIVVLDMDRKEIKDSYYIGKNGGYINIRDITSDVNYLYAATDSGVYRASLSSPNLSDYNSWNKLSGIPKGIYNTIAVLNGKVYANYSGRLTKSVWADTIYSFNGISWSRSQIADTMGYEPLNKMEVFNNQLVFSFAGSVNFFDTAGTWTGKRIGGFLANPPINMEPRQAIVDAANSKTLWIADYLNGMIKNVDTWGGTTAFYPTGPNTSEVYAMSILNEDLWVARGNHSETWVGVYNGAEVYKFSNENWSSITKNNIPALDTMRDICSVAVDPANKEHVYLGTTGAGVVELMNGSLVKVWNEANTANNLQSILPYHWLGIFGLAFDTNRNLWVSSTNAPNPLSVRKADGSWQSFNFNTVAPHTPTVGSLIVNQYNQKWMILPRQGGILVFDENETWTTGDDKMKKLSFTTGNGAIPGGEVYCLAEDRNGEIWVGTDKGIGVFYCPDQIFSSSGCDAQQIYIEQDGHTQLLLVTEAVTTIAVDGANQKWIGTQNSGVFLMSADGTKQLQHFTMDNSPLLSNEITSIVIHPRTGEVFIGTVDGIISYRNDATEGLEDFTDVYVFPNPVKPGYEGPIAITGLVENANVKITDISGTLVYQTKALGGQAIWYGKNFKGERAHSGVYMVFCANDDGTKTFVTKILLVN
ncbi:MAG: T9SS type A sorting domain-containing protein [Bacteroidetes bacterium]|nr:T9SS type A sorting domain-containing protein [Bacteroidota bacterium]